MDPAGDGQVRVKRSAEVDRDLAVFCTRYPMEMTPEDRRALDAGSDDHKAAERVVAEVLSGAYVPRAFEMAIPPRDYQRVAADLWLRRGSLILGDSLGLGKTISAITGLSDPSTRPALVVTLSHLTEQWKREVLRCLPTARVHVLDGTRPYDIAAAWAKEAREEGRVLVEPAFPDILITTYHRISGWADALAGKVASLVWDEVQELRHDETRKYEAALKLRRGATRACGLSATPTINMGSEMHRLVEVVDPGALGTWSEFLRTWCTSGGEKARVKDPKAFGLYLRESGIMLRRTRAEVGRELPAITIVPHHINADLDALDRVKGRAGELARTILRQRMGSDGGAAWLASGEFERLMRQQTGVAKAPYAAEIVEMILGTMERKKVVLFAFHREVWAIFENRLRDVGLVLFTGTETPREKRAGFDEFCKPKGPSVLGISLRAGTAGLDGLQHVCDTAVHAELDWAPAIHDQGDGRLHRDGQPNPVFSFRLLSDWGSDPVVADVCGIKRAQGEPIRNPLAEMVELRDVDPAHVRTLAAAYLESLHR